MIKSSLSCRCREIIIGSLLGDGSLRLHKAYKNARFSFRHSAKQEEYFYWKVYQMKEISSDNCVWKQNGKDGWGENKLRYQSLVTEELTQIYNLTHPHGHLKIRRKWLNKLTPLSLCVWWLDDGSLVSNCHQGVLCTDRFTFEELVVAVRYFRSVWNINFHIGRVAQSGPRASQHRLWLRSREGLKKFLRIILPHVPVQSMLTKVLILYKDPQLQERWISEMCQLSKWDRKIIEFYMNQRKSKLVHFQKMI